MLTNSTKSQEETDFAPIVYTAHQCRSSLAKDFTLSFVCTHVNIYCLSNFLAHLFLAKGVRVQASVLQLGRSYCYEYVKLGKERES